MTNYRIILLAVFIGLTCGRAFADDYGGDWASFSEDSRQVYVFGYLAGMKIGGEFGCDYLATALDDVSGIDYDGMTADFRANLVVQIEPSVIVRQVTALYEQDPANALIHYGRMVDIAIRKIKGLPFESLLIQNRQAVLASE